MNKKTYIEPNIEVVNIAIQQVVLAGSDPSLSKESVKSGTTILSSEYAGDDSNEDW